MRRARGFLILALTGCAAAPGYRPSGVVVPAAFRETRDGATPVPVAPDSLAPDSLARTSAAVVPNAADYWRELGDTMLDRLMGELTRSNLDIQTAAARVRGARAVRIDAALDLAPTVTFAGGYTRQRLSGVSFPIGTGSFPDQDIWDGGFDASWELDLFGRVRRNLQAQGAFVAVAQEDLRDIRVSLTAELARSYFELRGAQERLAVARRNSENQHRSLEVTRQRLDAGRGTAFDTERAEAQLDFTLASIPPLEASVAAAQYRVGVLVGRPPASVAEELDSAGALPSFPAQVRVDAPDSVVRGRPDVAAAEREAAARRTLVGAAKADYLPRLSLGGSAGLTATTFDSLGDRGTFRYAVGPVISWPALNLGRVKSRVDAAQAREAEAQARYRQTVLRALEDVEGALSRYRSAQARVARIAGAAEASERAAELARLRFSGGVADFLQVLDAERTQLDAEDQLAQGRTDAATAYAALYKALGGGWPAVAGDH